MCETWKILLLMPALISNLDAFNQKVNFYIQAHQDDWQIFMSSKTHQDVENGEKVVFITTTAGDAGLGNKGDGKIPFYKARENGSKLSVRFLMDMGRKPSAMAEEWVLINEYKIYKCSYKNSVSYFLNLPSGNLFGSGHAGTNYESLESLFSKNLFQSWGTITSVDSSATYQDWNALKKTLQMIISSETGVSKIIRTNYADIDAGINPGDHSDHTYTTILAREALKEMPHIGITTYVTYFSHHLSANLSTSQLKNSSALHACDVIGVTEEGYSSNWDYQHKLWLDANYYRILRFPSIDPTHLEPSTVINILGQETLYSPMIESISEDPKQPNKIQTEIEIHEKGKLGLTIYSSSGEMINKLEKDISQSEKVSLTLPKKLPPGTYYLHATLNSYFKDLRQFIID